MRILENFLYEEKLKLLAHYENYTMEEIIASLLGYSIETITDSLTWCLNNNFTLKEYVEFFNNNKGE